MAVNDIIRYLGTGMKNPVALIEGRAVITGGRELIEQSVLDILSTPIGTRLFNRPYGSRLHELLFEPNDEVLESLLETFVFEAVSKWETRAKLEGRLEFASSEAAVEITMKFKILSSNEIFSFVYPFYRELKY
jgi:phage baseplate assembly protein W